MCVARDCLINVNLQHYDRRSVLQSNAKAVVQQMTHYPIQRLQPRKLQAPSGTLHIMFVESVRERENEMTRRVEQRRER